VCFNYYGISLLKEFPLVLPLEEYSQKVVIKQKKINTKKLARSDCQMEVVFHHALKESATL